MNSISDIMNPINLLELEPNSNEFDEEQFKVQPVNHDNDVDCDGMCCSDCTVSNCPVRDCKIIVKHM